MSALRQSLCRRGHMATIFAAVSIISVSGSENSFRYPRTREHSYILKRERSSFLVLEKLRLAVKGNMWHMSGDAAPVTKHRDPSLCFTWTEKA